jgi:hypothetical protein
VSMHREQLDTTASASIRSYHLLRVINHYHDQNSGMSEICLRFEMSTRILTTRTVLRILMSR